MRLLFVTLIILTAGLQWTLWFGKNGIIDLWESRQMLSSSKFENQQLKQRNDILKAEVLDLQTGLKAVEERARSELGLVKEDEIFIQIIEEKDSNE